MNKNELQQAIKSGEFVIIGECLPPKSAESDIIASCARQLADKVHAISVIESEDGPRLCSLAACIHLASEGAQPILHLLTRDMNRIALQATILGATSAGVTNFFCTAGRHQVLTREPHARGVFDIDPIQLLSIARNVEISVSSEAEQTESLTKFTLGTDINPYAQPMELQILVLEKAIAQGADFVVTQPIFKIDTFANWLSMAQERGLCSKTCIVAAVKPLTSAEEAADLRESHKAFDIPEHIITELKDAKDPRSTGINLTAKIITEIQDMDGVRGIYLMTGENPALALDLISATGLSRS